LQERYCQAQVGLKPCTYNIPIPADSRLLVVRAIFFFFRRLLRLRFAGFPILPTREDGVEHGVAGFVRPFGGLFVQVALGDRSGEVQ
jgi:hypothetical protein